MQTWIKIIPPEELNPETYYFLGARLGMDGVHFWSEMKNGKRQWTSKPGIALLYKGTETLAETIKGNPKYCAIEIPADAAKRWKRRK